MQERVKKGVVERPRGKGKVYAVRFQIHGERHYLTLGSPEEGWTRRRAKERLHELRADVGRGRGIPPRRCHQAPRTMAGGDLEDFERFARDQIAGRRADVAPATSRYREWALSHLLPYFSGWRLAEIDARAIDGYRAHKVGESEARRHALKRGRPMRDRRGQALRPLSSASINKTIDVLQWLFSLAVEYGHVDKNPALGRRRRLTVRRGRQRHLDSADQIEALLQAAAELDRDPRWLIADRLPVIATLLFAGLRAYELAALRWRDVDLPARRINVGRSKAPAGEREIALLPVLARYLLAHRDHLAPKGPDELVFRTRRGGIRTKDNVRWRILRPALVRADRLLEADGHPPLPEGLTPHSLRHTFASLLIATGEDPVSVMWQMGHTDPGFTLRTYGHLMRRDPGERARLRTLVSGRGVAPGPPPSTTGAEVSSAGLRRGFSRSVDLSRRNAWTVQEVLQLRSPPDSATSAPAAPKKASMRSAATAGGSAEIRRLNPLMEARSGG